MLGILLKLFEGLDEGNNNELNSNLGFHETQDLSTVYMCLKEKHMRRDLEDSIKQYTAKDSKEEMGLYIWKKTCMKNRFFSNEEENALGSQSKHFFSFLESNSAQIRVLDISLIIDYGTIPFRSISYPL